MQMFYSPSANGFFCEAVNGAAIPSDRIEISAELYASLAGKGIEPGPDGSPREITPPTHAPTAPKSVTMRQARLALLEAGRLAAVNAAIAAMPSPQKEAAQIEWEFASHVERQSPFLQGLAAAINLDGADLDQLFILAASK